MVSIFGQGYMQTAPSFSMPNSGQALYTSGYNGRAYTNPNSNYQVMYIIIAYTDPIPLHDSCLFPTHSASRARKTDGERPLPAMDWGARTRNRARAGNTKPNWAPVACYKTRSSGGEQEKRDRENLH
jgi:hypothetical protein